MRYVCVCAVWLAIGMVVASFEFIEASEEGTLGDMAVPQYTAEGRLIRPENYETWVHVGTSLGLGYNERMQTEGPGNFNSVYIQPQAYAHYKETGTFPEKTMLVMEVYRADGKAEPALSGHFSGEFRGIEVALKDSAHIEEGWGYYNFIGKEGPLPEAMHFPRVACFDCHAEHAADDNVFVQFYPRLKQEMVRQGRWRETAEDGE